MAPAQVTVLTFIHGKYQGQEFPLDRDACIAGRSSESDLVLADDAVSRKHARFYAQRGRYWVVDLGSRNGTLVNGKTIEKHCLRAGDRIRIGSSLAKVEERSSSTVSAKRAGEPGRRNDGSNRSMSGSIEDIPLMDVLQWLATSRKTGALKVKDPAGGHLGALHLRNGSVFYAVIEGNEHLHPHKALLRMLTWNRGYFELSNTIIDDPPAVIDMSLEHMLMEAARQEDELTELRRQIPLPRRGDPVTLAKGTSSRWRELEPELLDLVQSIVVAGSWWQALDASPEEDLTLYKRLATLREQGIVEY